MTKTRYAIWIILLLTVFSAIIDIPNNVPIKFSIGNLKIDRVISAPNIDIGLGPLRIQKTIETRYGLDLSGGTHLVLEADMKDVPKEDQEVALSSAKEIVERRVNLYGLTEPVVQSSKVGDSHRILVELPGVSDVSDAVQLIGRTAELRFFEEASNAGELATSSAYVNLWTTPTELTGKNLRKSQVTYGQTTGTPEVSLEFDAKGAKLFEEITERNVGKTVGIMLDDQIISAPLVNARITGGNAVIQGNFTAEDAKNLSIALNAGALPVPIKIIGQTSIGATLGLQSVQKSIVAGFIGLGIVAVFMIFMYGRLGIAAVLALIVYTLITLAIFRLIPVTLTLAGIAGFILSIGMAVDANILIFERMKEEIRWGKSREVALRLGFERALPSIKDANISSLITCTILYWFGTGIVRGFAVTLAIGILVSLFSAITVTRTFLRYLYK